MLWLPPSRYLAACNFFQDWAPDIPHSPADLDARYRRQPNIVKDHPWYLAFSTRFPDSERVKWGRKHGGIRWCVTTIPLIPTTQLQQSCNNFCKQYICNKQRCVYPSPPPGVSPRLCVVPLLVMDTTTTVNKCVSSAQQLQPRSRISSTASLS